MQKLKLYLDNCCFNRPFDDQSQLIVRLETEAVLFILEKIKTGDIKLIWSYILDSENNASPSLRRKKSVHAWKSFAQSDVVESETLLKLMESFEDRGVKSFDALHLAAAVVASADFFVTVDRGILNKSLPEIRVCTPENFVRYYTEVKNDE